MPTGNKGLAMQSYSVSSSPRNILTTVKTLPIVPLLLFSQLAFSMQFGEFYTMNSRDRKRVTILVFFLTLISYTSYAKIYEVIRMSEKKAARSLLKSWATPPVSNGTNWPATWGRNRSNRTPDRGC